MTTRPRRSLTLTCPLLLLLLPALPLIAQEAKPDFSDSGALADETDARQDAASVSKTTSAEIAVDDAMEILRTLASKRYEGRGTGLKGELKATAFIAEMLEGFGLQPAGDSGTYFQRYPFPTGAVEMGADSHAELFMEITAEEEAEISVKLRPDIDYLPLAFGMPGEGNSGKLDPSEVVFAGYGIRRDDYDNFAGLDVKGKWIAVLRGVPDKATKAMQGDGPLIAKANTARELGAAGIIFIKGFNDKIPTELVPLTTRFGIQKILPALSISNKYAEMLLTLKLTDGNQGLQDLYQKYTSREEVAGFETDFGLSARIDLERTMSHGRNVLARLQVGERPSDQVVMIGAHADHVGFGLRGGSRAKGLTSGRIHPGADDNGSGVSGLLEIAQYLADLHRRGELKAQRDIVFATWTGEEMGLIGSKFWVDSARENTDNLHPTIAAYFNMDMIGRVRNNKLKLQGTGSSSVWPSLIEACSGSTNLDLEQEASPHIPTDVASFTAAGVPILAAFSGLHAEYHTPGDTPGKINYDGLVGAARFMAEVLQMVAAAEEVPDFINYERKGDAPKVIIGFVPEDTGEGIGIAQITPGSAAEKAGLQAGDVVLELDKKAVTDLDSLQKILRQLKPGTTYPMRFRRGDETRSITVVPDKR